MANDWWSRHLGGGATPAPNNLPQTTLPQYPSYVPQMPQNPQVTYDPNRDQLVSRAQSSRMNERCPGCMSGNYFAPTGTQLKRCYDCGYPIVQAGTGAGMPSGSGGPTTPAKQVGQSGGFNPTVIVDRIG